MSGLLVLLIMFVVIIKFVDIIVVSVKKRDKTRGAQFLNLNQIMKQSRNGKGYVKGKYHKIYKYDDVTRFERSDICNKPEVSQLKSNYQKIYGNDNKVQGNINRFERPDTQNEPEVSQQEEIIWTRLFLKSLEWKRYEEVCTEYLRIKNCQADVTCVGADGGIDIKISDSSGVVFAAGQCKAWSRPIGVSLIRELYGVMAADRIKTGIFLTTSEFTNDALAFAKGKNLLLIDCDELINLINGLDDVSKKRINLIATEGDYTTPTCVNCDVKMVKRTAKNGNNSGRQFWGCVNFPKCKNVMVVK